MTEPKYTPEVLDALTKTLTAYRTTIDILNSTTHSKEAKAEVLSKWDEYGNFPACRLCVATGKPTAFKYDCTRCPLSSDEALSVPCVDDLITQEDTQGKLNDILIDYFDGNTTHSAISQAMQNRLDFLVTRSQENINAQ